MRRRDRKLFQTAGGVKENTLTTTVRKLSSGKERRPVLDKQREQRRLE